MKIYLAGKITGLDRNDAINWRINTSNKFKDKAK